MRRSSPAHYGLTSWKECLKVQWPPSSDVHCGQRQRCPHLPAGHGSGHSERGCGGTRVLEHSQRAEGHASSLPIAQIGTLSPESPYVSPTEAPSVALRGSRVSQPSSPHFWNRIVFFQSHGKCYTDVVSRHHEALALGQVENLLPRGALLVNTQLVEWFWARCFASPSPSFLICKLGIGKDHVPCRDWRLWHQGPWHRVQVLLRRE